MKKIVVLILALSMVFTLCACGDSNDSAAPTTEPTPEPTEEPIKEIKIGETIKTDNYEITIDDIVIGPEQADLVIHNKYQIGSWYSYDYHAFVVVTVKNLLKEAMEISRYRDSYVNVQLDYNNGFIYGFTNKDNDLHVLGDSGTWNNFSGLDVSPLAKGKAIWNIKIVEDVYTNRDVPLYVVITMGDGEVYRYQVSESDYLD